MVKSIPETVPDDDMTRIDERPDGFYWQSRGGKEYGPFATLLEAVQDMQAGGEDAIEPGETLAEAEAELGVADWINEETGELAEDGIPRLEQH